MDQQLLKELFSEFWEIDISKIHDKLEFDNSVINNFSSIRFYQFIAALESNFDVKISKINEILTYGDLVKNII